MIHLGNNLDVLPGLPADSFDSVVTDPPYGLSFMGKDWDQGIPGTKFWAEIHRVAKPGAHLLAFGGTRTFHRLTCAIEDAGWEIRDCVMWVYGSGFPKSLNVSSAISKLAEPNAEPNAEEVEFCEWLRANSTREHVCSTLGKRFWDCEVQIVNTATKERPILGRRALVPTAARWRLFKAGHSEEIPVRIEQLAKPEPSRAETPGEEWTPGKGNGSVGCGQWSGWGTALKPAWEPIIVARKPLCGTVAENVLRHGTGGINVDACRIATNGEVIHVPQSDPTKRGGVVGSDLGISNAGVLDFQEAQRASVERANTMGRWPANIVHDGSDEVLAVASNAARFFYCAKASKSDRGADNNHPTVKPTTLMRYLCRLVTPPGGTVFDPFMGSGSTGKAAILEGFQFSGIELNEEYFRIAEARLAVARRALEGDR